VAGKVQDGTFGAEDAVQHILRELQLIGIEPTFDWTTQQQKIQKPYLAHRSQNRESAETMLRATAEADIFVLVMGGEVYGAIGEFLAYCQAHTPSHRLAYVLGNPDEFRQSLFMCLNGVIVVETIEDLVAEITRLVSEL